MKWVFAIIAAILLVIDHLSTVYLNSAAGIYYEDVFENNFSIIFRPQTTRH